MSLACLTLMLATVANTGDPIVAAELDGNAIQFCQESQEPCRAINVNVVVVEASNDIPEGAANSPNEPPNKKYFGPGLDAVKSALANLKYRSFRKLGAQKLVAERDQETTMRIDAKYTLGVTLLDQDTLGRFRVKARIEEKVRKGDKVIKRNALLTTTALAPGKHLVLGGPKLEKGQLVLVLTAERPPQPASEQKAAAPGLADTNEASG